MRVIVYLHGEGLLEHLAMKQRTLKWLADTIGVNQERVWCWINKRNGVSPANRTKILKVFKYDPIQAKYKREGKDWHEILFEVKIKYKKGECSDEMLHL